MLCISLSGVWSHGDIEEDLQVAEEFKIVGDILMTIPIIQSRQDDNESNEEQWFRIYGELKRQIILKTEVIKEYVKFIGHILLTTIIIRYHHTFSKIQIIKKL